MSIDRPTASEARSGGFRRRGRSLPAPAVFAVHDEGDGIVALYLRAFPLSVLAELMARTGTAPEELVEISASWGVRSRIRSLAQIEGRVELEVVHDPSADSSDVSVLVDPARALPADGRFALHRAYDGHAIVFARDDRILVEALRAYLDTWTIAHGLDRPPVIPEHALQGLTAPVPPDAWREARLVQHRRHCVLDVTTFDDGHDDPGLERWVARPGGEWRTGWSW